VHKGRREPLQRDKTLEILMSLGLTYLQAKSYLALTQLDRAEARLIAEASDVARQDIYRVLPTLEKLGLAEKIVGSPIVYRATPLREGLMMLLRERTTEDAMLRKKVKSLLNNDQEGRMHSIIHEDSSQFVITSEKKLLVKKFQKSFMEATTCDLIFPEYCWNFIVFNLSECIRIAIAKSAKIRIITEKWDTKPSITRKLETLRQSPFFQIKFAFSPIDYGLAIFDDEEMNVCVSSNPSVVPSLWTNNFQLLRMAKITFENEWNKASGLLDHRSKILNSTTDEPDNYQRIAH
jgi:sugar-specific transcriptional regulator TrmB